MRRGTLRRPLLQRWQHRLPQQGEQLGWQGSEPRRQRLLSDLGWLDPQQLFPRQHALQLTDRGDLPPDQAQQDPDHDRQAQDPFPVPHATIAIPQSEDGRIEQQLQLRIHLRGGGSRDRAWTGVVAFQFDGTTGSTTAGHGTDFRDTSRSAPTKHRIRTRQTSLKL